MTGNTPLVLDNGTGMFKLGFAHERFPRATLPTLLGTPKYPSVLVDELADHIYVGHEALNNRGALTLTNPMKHSMVADWDALICLCEYIFSKELNVDTKEQSLLVAVPSFLPETQRENLATIFFETFEVPALYIIDQALLALYASARTTGLVIDCGEGSTCITSVYETYYISAATCCHMAAGNTVTQHLKRLLPEIGCRLYTSAEHEIAREIKERTCYVAMDYQEELKKVLTGQTPPEVYSLPDGRHLNLTTERFRAPEILFSPNLFGSEFQGITSLITGSIDRCPTDLRKHLLSNIVLSGGTTLLRGFTERLTEELRATVSSDLPLIISSPPHRQYTVWLGGSILASSQSFAQMWITSQEYKELGSKAILNK